MLEFKAKCKCGWVLKAEWGYYFEAERYLTICPKCKREIVMKLVVKEPSKASEHPLAQQEPEEIPRQEKIPVVLPQSSSNIVAAG